MVTATIMCQYSHQLCVGCRVEMFNVRLKSTNHLKWLVKVTIDHINYKINALTCFSMSPSASKFC